MAVGENGRLQGAWRKLLALLQGLGGPVQIVARIDQDIAMLRVLIIPKLEELWLTKAKTPLESSVRLLSSWWCGCPLRNGKAGIGLLSCARFASCFPGKGRTGSRGKTCNTQGAQQHTPLCSWYSSLKNDGVPVFPSS